MVTHSYNCDISRYTTFQLPAVVDEFIEYDSVDELVEIVKELNTAGKVFMRIGGGSNMLFSSRYSGAILHCRCSKIEEVDCGADSVILYASAGTSWDCFVKHTVDNGFYGAVNLSYIPGEVGGAAVQNVGAYGSEAKDIIESVDAVDTTDCSFNRLSVVDCCYGYRDSVFKHIPGRYIVTGVRFRLSLVPEYELEYGSLKDMLCDPDLTLSKVRDKIIEIRRSKLPDPSELGSAGSFFKNPVVNGDVYSELKAKYPDIPSYVQPDGKVKIPAGWLIEHSGLKGHRIGGAQIYPKQCLVIVNTGNATASDVLELKEFVQNTVKSKFGISIFPEVNIIA